MGHTRRVLALAGSATFLAFTMSLAASGAPSKSPPPSKSAPAPIAALAPFGFLLGSWDASGGGRPGASAGTFVFSLEAGGRAVLRHNASTSPEGEHRDVMLVHLAGPDSLTAVYVDSEGHVIDYGVTSPAPNTVVFESAPVPGTPRFRLSYHLDDAGVLQTRFELIPPGKSEYTTYLEGSAKRSRGNEKDHD